MADDLPYVFHWKNTVERAALYGKRCRILAKGSKMRSVLVEFEDGQKHVVSARSLRRVDENEQTRLV